METFTSKTVLVTGGSTGIGAAFARELARRQANLVLVARSEAKLRALAAELEREHGVTVHVIPADLARPGAAASLREAVRARGVTIDLLINNAGFATYGRFDTLSIETQREEIDLNVGTLVELTWAFLPDLLDRRGGLLNVASTAAFQPVPYMAVYGATKSFVLSFSEALWAEYRPRGLRVLALCPGATDTPFFERVGAEEASLGVRARPERVVAEALAAYAAGRSHLIIGTSNYLLAQASRFLPRASAARIAERTMRPRRPELPSPATSRR
ncbi:SDR family oxidoreductase [Haliangium sp. UPWRP_2]|uniref:SDR family NAD(P)-dependent oxidoreductase n=1 Tax=Haliangium sp. UPWRP_2 TaxID=1931276 RepID=UPI000B542AB3|nr:SDR family oxidoreductase [Haliangium sp. UPWRP_2]PSM31062.1 SDR family NAD(P)-dependent oxidoreductase [Haliangium sp. UPWRP_2]